MAKVLVLGGTGFVGSHAVRSCLESGHEVAVGTTPGPEPDLLADVAAGIRFVPGDITHWPDLLAGLRAAEPDVVVHCAGYALGGAGLMNSAAEEPARAVDVNVVGFSNVLHAMAELRVPRLVWTSSSAALGPADIYADQLVDEEAPYLPRSLYGGSKMLAEILARQFRQEGRVETVGVRLPFVYGPRRWYIGQWSAIHEVFHAAAFGRSTTVRCTDDALDLLYAPDAGRVLAACVSAREVPHDRYNIVGHRHSVPELVDVARAIKPGLDISLELSERSARPAAMEDDRIRKELAFFPEFDVEAAARDYVEWLTVNDANTE